MRAKVQTINCKYIASIYISIFFCAIGALLVGCENKANKNGNYITQCISMLGGGHASKIFDVEINNNKRKCYALIWKIPPKYLIKKINSNRSDPIVDSLSIKLLPQRTINEPKVSTLVPEIIFSASWGTFDYMRNFSAFNEIKAIWALEKLRNKYHGLNVYVSNESKRKGQRNLIFFVPEGPWRYTVSCFYTGSYESIRLNSLCWVESDVDGRVYAKYSIYYSQVNEIEEISQSVTSFAKNFMLN